MTFVQILLSLSVVISFNTTELQELSYIDKYQSLAIAEMKRTGIPASIKLAQALVESNAGSSVLANRANNHFGIKCKVEWTGVKYYYADDDLDASGQLIESCFRAYQTPEESYLDHSDFLITRDRYTGLFKLSKKDYSGWAFSLKKYGYATDPDYAQKLIKKIEKYRLYLLDEEGGALLFQG